MDLKRYKLCEDGNLVPDEDGCFILWEDIEQELEKLKQREEWNEYLISQQARTMKELSDQIVSLIRMKSHPATKLKAG